MSKHAGLVAVLVTLCTLGTTGCYVRAEADPPVLTSAEVGPAADDGYVPAYYDGYVVYYDDVGHPYYYDRGAVVWVAPSSPFYIGLTNHWHYYGRGYAGWYAHSGYRYRGYRGAPGYHAYHGYAGHGGGRGYRR